ncbi:tetratricopeptide repeat protein [Rubellimicrobium roseum]|uniref:Tetratricopeptide repeat protein n=1 Tax=Rubellimicrobium roseum TaxID=687525 RepID=A0A5C4NB44_9RHOB|nr:tetratricopeptide repeat protein [Rubellimicrobium roseum]TNC70933.1 tetratricopeptide repeat protein [Rubellimicrobium roseum]
MGRTLLCLAALAGLAACGVPGINRAADGVYAPGVAPGGGADPLETGHRLMAAGQHQLALDAYMRAAAEDGLTPDTLAGMGSANLRLGRLGQAERLLREAVEEDPRFVPAWNNLGVLLMEQEKYGEASEVFRRAYAADSGNSDTIRNNLRLALARMQDPFYTGVLEGDQAPTGDLGGQVQLIGVGDEGALRPEDALLAIEPL